MKTATGYKQPTGNIKFYVLTKNKVVIANLLIINDFRTKNDGNPSNCDHS